MQITPQLYGLADAVLEKTAYFSSNQKYNKQDLDTNYGTASGLVAGMDTDTGLFGGSYQNKRNSINNQEAYARHKLDELTNMKMSDEERKQYTDRYNKLISMAKTKRQDLDNASPIRSAWRDSFGQRLTNWITGRGFRGESEINEQKMGDLYGKRYFDSENA